MEEYKKQYSYIPETIEVPENFFADGGSITVSFNDVSGLCTFSTRDLYEMSKNKPLLTFTEFAENKKKVSKYTKK